MTVPKQLQSVLVLAVGALLGYAVASSGPRMMVEAGTARTANPKVYVRASTSRQPSVRFAVSTSRSSQDTSPKAG